MRQFHLKKNIHYRPTVNLDRIWSLIPKSTQEEASSDKSKTLLIDVTKFGYHKVLGKGKLPSLPVIIKAKFFSKKAERKIKEVGGACVLTA